MKTSTAVRMPDGTVCRKGVNCRRHGIKHLLNQVSSVSSHKNNKTSATSVLGVSSGQQTGFLDDKTPRKYSGDKITYYERAKPTREYFRGLPPEKKHLTDSMAHYMMSGHDYINGYLRGGRSYKDYLNEREAKNSLYFGRAREQEYIDNAERHVKIIDSVLEQLPSEPENSVVYRSVPSHVAESMKVGDTLHDEAYMSTSEDPQLMLLNEEQSLAQNQGSITVFEIMTSRNKFVGGVRSNSLAGLEKEHLLPRGTTLKAVAIKTVTYEAHEAKFDHVSNGYENSIRKKKMKVIQLVDVTDEEKSLTFRY